MSAHHTPRKMLWGHIIERTKSTYMVFYLALLGSQHLFTPGTPLPTWTWMMLLVGLLVLTLFQHILHRACMLCIIPAGDPATTADQKRLWLALFHTRAAWVLSSLVVVPTAVYVVGIISDAQGTIGMFFYTLAACYALTCIADIHHTRLVLWCHVCNPGNGGNGDHHPTPIPTAPTTKE